MKPSLSKAMKPPTVVPWDEGTMIPSGASLDDFLQVAGLDWQAATRPLFFEHEGKFIPIRDLRAMQRADNGDLLDTIGSVYIPYQNRDVMSLFHAMLGAHGLCIDWAGSADRGRGIWALAALGVRFTLCEGDEVDAYIGCFIPHIYKDGPELRVIALRTCDMTMFRLPLVSLRGNRTRPGKDDTFKAIWINEGVKTACDIFYNFHSLCQLLQATPISAEDEKMFIQKASFHGSGNTRPEGKTVRSITEAIREGPGTSIPGVVGTWWGAICGLNYWAEYVRDGQGGRLWNAWFSDQAYRKDKMLRIAIDRCTALQREKDNARNQTERLS